MAELSPTLEVMRVVSGNGKVDSTDGLYPLYVAYTELKAENPSQFRKEWLAEEKKLSVVADPDPGPDWDGLGTCPTCNRPPEVKISSEAALAAAKDWLAKNRSQ